MAKSMYSLDCQSRCRSTDIDYGIVRMDVVADLI